MQRESLEKQKQTEKANLGANIRGDMHIIKAHTCHYSRVVNLNLQLSKLKLVLGIGLKNEVIGVVFTIVL